MNGGDRGGIDQQILTLLIEDRGPWAVAELERALGEQLDVADGIERLRRGGLLHRVGEFVFTSRAAREAAEAWGPLTATREGGC